MDPMAERIYQSISARTGGDIYIGVVGPVRTGKSTLIKRLMETLVLPNIENVYRKERAKDELPQSASGRTIMTAEPKFVPEEAVEIKPDGKTSLRIRLIDSVGYLIPGAMGAEEDGQPRMITTPWQDTQIPLAKAAELGTRKIMEEHCTVGIVVTTDGTVTDIPRADYVQAENASIADMKKTGKPFLILVNSSEPDGPQAQALAKQLEETWQVPCMTVNAGSMGQQDFLRVFQTLLQTFPVQEIRIRLPGWLLSLPDQHPMKATLFQAAKNTCRNIHSLWDAEAAMEALSELEQVEQTEHVQTFPGTGTVQCSLRFPEGLFYEVLSQRSGFTVDSDTQLLELLSELSQVKQAYDKVSSALEQVQATGYGIVMPSVTEMELQMPKVVRKSGNYGVSLKATAPSIHMMRADIDTEVCPMTGSEKQSQELMQYLVNDCEGDNEKLWESRIFGRSVSDLVSESLMTKLHHIPDHARKKLQSTVSRMANEGCSGLLCIILG